MEEIEELGELQELPPCGEERVDESFLGVECISHMQKSLLASPTPTMLLDTQLRIRWVNESFETKLGSSSSALGVHLTRFFKDDFSDEKKRALYRSIYRGQNGFSWQGRIEKKGLDQLALITNLLLLPIFPPGELREQPIAFQGIFDDISSEYRQMLKNTYDSIVGAARLKDNDTGNHIQRVNLYSKLLAEVLLGSAEYPEVDQEYLANIGYLAAMHDVGKIGTPDDILNKQGPLEPWEWEIMKEHTINGAYIFSKYPNPMAREIALRHHEHWDGSGYPHGVSGRMIPLSARIVSVADVYDALRMKRSYKQALPHEKSRDMVLAGGGTQFDPLLIERFERVERQFQSIFEQLKDPDLG